VCNFKGNPGRKRLGGVDEKKTGIASVAGGKYGNAIKIVSKRGFFLDLL